MPNVQRPKAVVFDLDGLLFNTEELYLEVGSELMRRRGKEFTPELRKHTMGRPTHVSLGIMIEWHQLDATVERLLVETDEIFKVILAERLAFMPGAAALLDALPKAGVPMALATSSRRSYAEYVLGRFELVPRFQFLLTAEDVTHGKPHPEIYQTAAARLGVSPGEMVVLEDSENGCRAAGAAGAIAVAVPAEHSREHDFSAARLVIDTLADDRLYTLLDLPRAAQGMAAR